MSKAVYLAGPIEYWWGRFETSEAVSYRYHRDWVHSFFVDRGYLVYSPHNAFKGPWDDKMQPVNDFVLERCDIVINMSPPGIPGNGTAGEWTLAKKLGKICIEVPPQTSKELLELILETERLKNKW